ncbi:hypothetical protein FOA52_007171 [Chlamydomonas sp. UWO 241]|nr:hypothetical protein FOA52_007171 [Chlamydomonas sp. UWO 241]
MSAEAGMASAEPLVAAASGLVDAATAVHSIGKQDVPHAAAAWEFWRKMGAPKYHVAPMVDQSELAFRQLCRAHGATAAYTPMFHARLFAEDKKYREDVWTTCPGDRPLLVQFCANDPNYLVRAAQHVQNDCDAIDINFGCPQRIAKRGFYGAFLMDNLELVEKLVSELVASVKVPVTCKIRIFPEIEQTLAYARMIERAGCSVLAVHGRTREQKNTTETRADWEPIRLVKQALSIPVLANGNIRNLADADALMAYTGCDGVMSAESLLVDPGLYAPTRISEPFTPAHGISLLREYLHLVQQYPTPMRMVKGHVHKLIGGWLSEFHDLRDLTNIGRLDIQGLLDKVVDELEVRVKALGRTHPVAVLTDRALARLEAEAAKQASGGSQLGGRANGQGASAAEAEAAKQVGLAPG